MNTAKQNYNVQKWICGLSVILFAVKIFAWYLTNSLSILTDALESIVNVIAGFIGLYSLYVAAKPKDMDHPYGHGKAEFVSAAAEGALIIGAGLLVLYETIDSIVKHEPIQKLDKGIILIAITAVVNYIAGALCIGVGKKNDSLALRSSGKHLQLDTYTTLGITLGLVIIWFSKVYWLDKVIAVAIAIMILINGYKILRESLAGIMDEADMELLKKMVASLNAHRRENWIDVHNLRVIKYGHLLHIDCHLTLPWYLNVEEAHAEVEQLRKLIQKEFPNALELFVHTDFVKAFTCEIEPIKENGIVHFTMKKRPDWSLESILKDK